MADQEIKLNWAGVFKVASTTKVSLSGDKIILPQSALEQLLKSSTDTSQSSSNYERVQSFTGQSRLSQWRDKSQQLPHPLTFCLMTSKDGKPVYAGIREFSAREGEVELSPFLRKALGIKQSSSENFQAEPGGLQTSTEIGTNTVDEGPSITICAKQLPKGKYVRLRPLEAGYNPGDWKSLLERYLRENFTTLTHGEVLTVRISKSQEYKFLIDKVIPQGGGICVIDVDLEVDIEALDEEQARETLRQIVSQSHQKDPTGSNHIGGKIDMWNPFVGQIPEGSYVDFTLSSWDRSRGITIEAGGEKIDLLVSPYHSRQRAKPREDEHVWADFSTESKKEITVTPSVIEPYDIEALYISLHVREGNPGLHEAFLRIQPLPLETLAKPTQDDQDGKIHSVNEEKCKNCLKWIPNRSITLHENFCRRNNILCPQCQNVFQNKSEEWQNHWHCEFDPAFGQTLASKKKHYEIFHTSMICPNCDYKARSLKDLASHRTSNCPGKLILCQFCHLEVPQDGNPYDQTPEELISELTAHELADGARTTNCHICSKITRLRDMATHLKHHELDKYKKAKPRICINVNCCRTLDVIQKNGTITAGNQAGQGLERTLGLCSICYGPLYANLYDPEGKALKRRIERRYLSQLITGCGKPWCQNKFCRTAQKTQLTSKTAMPTVEVLMKNVLTGPFYFCVDEECQKKRELASLLVTNNEYELEWILAALEAEGGKLEDAVTWLKNWAPKILTEQATNDV